MVYANGLLGLAVLSMCADLAASELKWIFLKIHYFGRKINWKRRSNKKEEQLEVEVKELIKIINQIRARHPEKHQITSDDILQVPTRFGFFPSDPSARFSTCKS